MGNSELAGPSDGVPYVRLKQDSSGRTRIPPPDLHHQSRPRVLIWPDGKVQFDPLPLFAPLMEGMQEDGEVSGAIIEEACDMMCRSSWGVRLLDITPFEGRYGLIPAWFPRRDSAGRRLIETAQVDRFLCFLGQTITLPKDHSTIDPAFLVMGLLELRDAYNEGAFGDWDEGHVWPYLPPRAG